jgi:hypothetical protein|tara:strand:+ start:1128 stop:1280 length:153 start_codon:yes stop_codon:yes gene_type:complete
MKKVANLEKTISKFISNVQKRDYATASAALSDAVNKKIEQKIINNNIKIF